LITSILEYSVFGLINQQRNIFPGSRCNNALAGVFAEQKLLSPKSAWMRILGIATISKKQCQNIDETTEKDYH